MVAVEEGAPSVRGPLPCRSAIPSRGRPDSSFCKAAGCGNPAEGGELTDAEWERVGPLLPPQKPRNGSGRRHDHRTVLAGILWVDRADGSWREAPEQFDK